MTNEELQHYGVLGMKWGVRRALRKSAENERLRKKALKLDRKSARMTAKSEKIHAEKDLGSSNIDKMKRKASTISKEDLEDGYAFVEELKRL